RSKVNIRLRDCFVVYSDRDQPEQIVPYAVVKDAFNSTENDCLSTCLHDTRCKGVMYGFVGGHQVIACELYDSPQTIQLIYAPYSNMFVLRGSSCEHAYEKILPLVVEKNEEVGAVSTRRKMRYRKAFEKKHRLRQQNFA
ncbi:unnamed protein product, partial [Toxocara canis]|uniref:Apple domain-containing protein n=1 Tax=Toxocara canis TaxID=6265 RepID=A0A183V3X8_TOXCA